MPIGQDISKTFRLPERQMQMAQLPSPVKATGGLGAGAQFEMPFDPAEELVLGKDELVKDYYDKYYKVRSFANAMAKQGIDVTTPDFNNPASLDANRLFMKAIADLKSTGDMMQQRRVSQVAEEKADREGEIQLTGDPDAYSGIRGDTTETAKAIDPQSRYSHVGLAPEVEEVNQMFSKSFDDKTMRFEAQQELDKLYSFYNDKLSSAKNERERVYAQRQLNALGKALYNPNKDEDQALEWSEFNEKKKKDVSSAFHRFTLLQRIMQGDTGVLESVNGIDNVSILPSGSLRYREKTGTSNGIPQYEWRSIDMTGDKGSDKGLLQINSLLSRDGAYEDISYEMLKQYQPVYTDRYGRIAAQDFGTDYFDKRNIAVEALQKGTPKGFWSNRGTIDERKVNNAIMNSINQMITAGNFNMPPGITSEDGIDSRGGEMITSISMDRRGEKDGGDSYVVKTIKNGEEHKYEFSTRDSEKLQLLIDENPSIIDAVKKSPQQEIKIKTPKGSYTVQELREAGYSEEQIQQIRSRYAQ